MDFLPDFQAMGIGGATFAMFVMLMVLLYSLHIHDRTSRIRCIGHRYKARFIRKKTA